MRGSTVESTAAVIEKLADWSSRVTYDDLTEEVRAKSRQGLMDTLGVALAGRDHEAAHRFAGTIHDLGTSTDSHAEGECTLLSGRRSSSYLAAQLFAYQAHVLDYDDTHFDAIVHVNSPVVATVLSLGEARSTSGRDSLVAHVVGVEMTSRIAIAASRQEPYGWHLTGTAGAFGAAAAASRLLGLDAERTAHALAISSTLSSGLRGHRGTMTKALNPAHAAGNGVFAAHAARRGMDASTQILDDPEVGYLVSHGAPHTTDLADGLPESLRMLDWDPKPYPCGVVIHPAVDVTLDVRADLAAPYDVAQVASVVVDVNPLALSLTGNASPRDGLEAKFSVFHAVATALLEGSLLPHHFTDEWVQDPAVVSMRDRVTANVREDLPRDEAAIKLHLTGGRTLEHRAKARGTRERRMTDADVEQKFLALAGAVVGDAAAGKLAGRLGKLQDEPDLGRLVREYIGRSVS